LNNYAFFLIFPDASIKHVKGRSQDIISKLELVLFLQSNDDEVLLDELATLRNVFSSFKLIPRDHPDLDVCFQEGGDSFWYLIL